MPSEGRRMLLGAVLSSTGLHLAGWRYPGVDPRMASTDVRHYLRMAALAEDGFMDFMFLADSLAVMYGSNHEVLRRIAPLNDYDPIILLGAIAAATDHIGLIATATTTYNDPFHLARRFASLDKISRGRAGWNVVTSLNADEDFNFAHENKLPIDQRYRRALEAVEVACKLWDSWEEEALLLDQAAGFYYDYTRVHPIDHEGEFFKVRGPLTMPRPPQGHPIIVQSGSSEPGRELGAQVADIVFTAQQTLAAAQAYYQDMKRRAVRHGRDADALKVIPGIVPILGRTDEEAEQKSAHLQSLIAPEVSLSLLSQLLGDIDLSGYPLDAPLPDLPSDKTAGARAQLIIATARQENLTIRQLASRAVSGARGHWTVVGSPERIASVMEEWFTSGAADGFSIIVPFLPEGLSDVVTLLVPELQKRGLVQSRYATGTLRDKLKLSKPSGRGPIHRQD